MHLQPHQKANSATVDTLATMAAELFAQPAATATGNAIDVGRPIVHFTSNPSYTPPYTPPAAPVAPVSPVSTISTLAPTAPPAQNSFAATLLAKLMGGGGYGPGYGYNPYYSAPYPAPYGYDPYAASYASYGAYPPYAAYPQAPAYDPYAAASYGYDAYAPAQPAYGYDPYGGGGGYAYAGVDGIDDGPFDMQAYLHTLWDAGEDWQGPFDAAGVDSVGRAPAVGDIQAVPFNIPQDAFNQLGQLAAQISVSPMAGMPAVPIMQPKSSTTPDPIAQLLQAANAAIPQVTATATTAIQAAPGLANQAVQTATQIARTHPITPSEDAKNHIKKIAKDLTKAALDSSAGQGAIEAVSDKALDQAKHSPEAQTMKSVAYAAGGAAAAALIGTGVYFATRKGGRR